MLSLKGSQWNWASIAHSGNLPLMYTIWTSFPPWMTSTQLPALPEITHQIHYLFSKPRLQVSFKNGYIFHLVVMLFSMLSFSSVIFTWCELLLNITASLYSALWQLRGISVHSWAQIAKERSQALSETKVVVAVTPAPLRWLCLSVSPATGGWAKENKQLILLSHEIALQTLRQTGKQLSVYQSKEREYQLPHL